METHLKWLNKTGLNELELVGGKNASLGEMICNLNNLGVKVPFGFVVTTQAYNYYMKVLIIVITQNPLLRKVEQKCNL